LKELIESTPWNGSHNMTHIFTPELTRMLLYRGSPSERCACGELVETHDDIFCQQCRIEIAMMQGRNDAEQLITEYGSHIVELIEWSDTLEPDAAAARETSRARALGE
jgi:hypothetical protein